MRLSLTDRCNLRCIYCVTEDESSGCLIKLKQEELLTYEELLWVVRVAVAMGITRSDSPEVSLWSGAGCWVLSAN